MRVSGVDETSLCRKKNSLEDKVLSAGNTTGQATPAPPLVNIALGIHILCFSSLCVLHKCPLTRKLCLLSVSKYKTVDWVCSRTGFCALNFSFRYDIFVSFSCSIFVFRAVK